MGDRASALAFLRERGLDEETVEVMRRKCGRLEEAGEAAAARARGNWAFLEAEVALPGRKIPAVVRRCPQLLVAGVDERLQPMLRCLRALGLSEKDLAGVVAGFPRVLLHSVDEKLCPVLAFLQAVGVREAALGKMVRRCPRLLSYSIDRKLAPAVRFLASLGLGREDVGRALALSPNILGYGVESRVRPTVEYLRGLGLSAEQLRSVAVSHPHVLCREPGRAFRQAEGYLRSVGFAAPEISALVGGFPPILTKSVRNSLAPKVRFLVNDMGLPMTDVLAFPAYFGYSLHRTIATRFRKMKARGVELGLSEMLGCNERQFEARIGGGGSEIGGALS